MADTTTLNPGTGGDTIYDEDIGGGVKMPASKIHTGAHGVDGGAVTVTNPLPIGVGDGAHADAFARLRTSGPTTTLFDSQQQYGDDATLWETQLTGSGAAANFLPHESTIQMTTGAATTGNSVIRQTKWYHRYQPGKSQLAAMTFVFDGGAVANVTRRIGYFDQNNGVFLEQNGTVDVAFTLRTYTSGSVSNAHRVAQASWNIDKFDGTGPSGITLDLTKTQILVIDLQWLGVGRVRIGFYINGILYYAHQFLNANATTTVYMTTANLPLRLELTNTGTAGSIATLRHICGIVMSEGGVEYSRGKQYGANTTATPATIHTRRPILSIQAATTGPNSVRNTGQILPKTFTVASTGSVDLFWELVLNPATFTGASFGSFGSASITNVDVAATAITGGTVMDSGYLNSSTQQSQLIVIRDLILVYSGLLNAQDVLSVCMTSVGASTAGFASITWQELW